MTKPQQPLCPVPRCTAKAKGERLLCALHWYSVPPHIRAQVKNGRTPVSFATAMADAFERETERQERIDNRREAEGLPL